MNYAAINYAAHESENTFIFVDNTNTRLRGKIQGRLSFTFMVQCRKKEKGMKFYWLLSIRGRRRFSGKVSPASSREVFA